MATDGEWKVGRMKALMGTLVGVILAVKVPWLGVLIGIGVIGGSWFVRVKQRKLTLTDTLVLTVCALAIGWVGVAGWMDVSGKEAFKKAEEQAKLNAVKEESERKQKFVNIADEVKSLFDKKDFTNALEKSKQARSIAKTASEQKDALFMLIASAAKLKDQKLLTEHLSVMLNVLEDKKLLNDLSSGAKSIPIQLLEGDDPAEELVSKTLKPAAKSRLEQLVKEEAQELADVPKVSPASIFNAFADNEPAAEKKFHDNSVILTGRISSINENAGHKNFCFTAPNGDDVGVMTILKDDQEDKVLEMKRGQLVSVLCQNSTSSLGSVRMDDCVIIETIKPEPVKCFKWIYPNDNACGAVFQKAEECKRSPSILKMGNEYSKKYCQPRKGSECKCG